MEKHNIDPVFDENSRILILGSFPSVKSRETKFFYGHPQNRFWKVIAAVCGESIPQTIDEKKMLLIRNNIAVWDVIESCDIVGSGDSSIKNAVPNKLERIFQTADIERVFCNGAAAYKLYCRYCQKQTGMEAQKLPSTSPANAAFSLERLINEWNMINT